MGHTLQRGGATRERNPMALEEYKRKRNFKQTPEPAGKVERGKGHRFVVQKHRASRLHYDFRLEMDGVLKSWAVPKGPSLDPADKRLAMQVEDHPVSYFDFEGIIPAGNYGAGTVMVWDLGTWEPEGDAHPMLAKGDFKFRLDGEKLKGSFALVHIRSRRPGNKGTEWLLIKHRDAYAQDGYDIEDFDHSALTGRTLDQIAADAGAREWESNRPAASSGRTTKNDWLAESIAKADAKKRNLATKSAISAAQVVSRSVPKKDTSKKRSVTDKTPAISTTVKKKSHPKKRLSS